MLDYSGVPFKINVNDVVAEWGGYPLQNPCVTPPGSPSHPVFGAKNSGMVEIKCFINNFCPFTQVDPVETTLVFNERTLEKVLPDFPAIYRNVLTTTEETEGIHFFPRYVFRNNYMYRIKDEFETKALEKEDEITDDSSFDDTYDEITDGKDSVNNNDFTRYKKEQSWVSVPSIFDTTFTNNAGEIECNRSKWVYDNDNISDSANSRRDIYHDYNTDIWNEYKNSLVWNSSTLEYELADDTKPVIDPNHVMFPQQQRTKDQLGKGVHWRVRKRTPLFRGEDFFIRFNKTAKHTTVNKKNTSIPRFNIDYYRSLDVTNDEVVMWDSQYPDIKLAKNLAVKELVDSEDEESSSKYYDFSSQAYYVIELGHRDPKENFFIIITERTFPICVNIQREVSKRMGNPFKGIKGKALIDSDWFVMTVRNHLGNLVIEFEGEGFKTEPWIVGKEEWEIDREEVDGVEVGLPILSTKPALLMVPRGGMTIWGGNIKCGFIFGPLQYAAGEAGFIYPPRRITTTNELDISISGSGGLEISGSSGGSIANPFFLPLNVDHKFTFAHPAIDKYELAKEIADDDRVTITPSQGGSDEKLFTQDAQYYRDFIDKVRNFTSGYQWEEEYGSYYYKETLKEINHIPSSNIFGKTSAITVEKYRYINDRVSNYQSFDTVIFMLVGDHVFHRSGVTYAGLDTGSGKAIWKRSGKLVDSEWLLGDCKTPIMTGLKLTSSGGRVPRWSDGTDIATGMALTPNDNPTNNIFNNSSGRLIDATEHVISYSDSWSATDFTQVDHTGTINFLLNTDFEFNPNVTGELFALQNKTFYIDIWAGYRDCNYSNVPGFFKMFTGLCHGGEIKYEYGKTVMSCKIVDFTDVLKDMLFFNSPFFDGMRDINAVYEILRIAGFREEGPVDPANIIWRISQGSFANDSTIFYRHIDGRPFKMEPFVLPSGYNRLDQPMFKFNDGSSLLDGILNISKKSAKVFFFDQLGMAHYEDLGDLIEQDFQGGLPLTPLYSFSTNPILYPGQLMLNSVEHAYAVQDVFSHIKMFSNTPDMHLLLMDHINFPALNNPDTEGFIGYKRTFYQQEGLFGSKAALKHAIRKYSVMFRPYVTYKFETYGVPLRANDMVEINGEIARVMNVNHEFDPSQNRWWMTVECKRYQPVGP